MSKQLSFLKTRFFGALQKLISILFCHLLEQGLYMNMELPSIHLLLGHFLGLLFVVVVFGAFVSLVSHVPTPKTPSFFQQLVMLIDRQSVNEHGIWVMFLSGKVVFLLWGFFLL
jgi:hypothetical protein